MRCYLSVLSHAGTVVEALLLNAGLCLDLQWWGSHPRKPCRIQEKCCVARRLGSAVAADSILPLVAFFSLVTEPAVGSVTGGLWFHTHMLRIMCQVRAVCLIKLISLLSAKECMHLFSTLVFPLHVFIQHELKYYPSVQRLPTECLFAGNGNGLLYCILFMIYIDRFSSALWTAHCHFPAWIQTSIFLSSAIR